VEVRLLLFFAFGFALNLGWSWGEVGSSLPTLRPETSQVGLAAHVFFLDAETKRE
jgi:hypothetical protein